MILEIEVNDVWIIHYPVPYKNYNDLTRPFIILSCFNNKFYGIPLTSFDTKRYRKEFGDILFETKFLSQKSIIKPYQLIAIKKANFIKKCGSIDKHLNLEINHKIESNVFLYLDFKNSNSIMREFLIEKQNQLINNLHQEIAKVKAEIAVSQKQLSILNLDRELLLIAANKIINELQQKLEYLQNQLIITK